MSFFSSLSLIIPLIISLLSYIVITSIYIVLKCFIWSLYYAKYLISFISLIFRTVDQTIWMKSLPIKMDLFLKLLFVYLIIQWAYYFTNQRLRMDSCLRFLIYWPIWDSLNTWVFEVSVSCRKSILKVKESFINTN